MLEILEFIFQGFWVWVGSFLMLALVCGAIVGLFGWAVKINYKSKK